MKRRQAHAGRVAAASFGIVAAASIAQACGSNSNGEGTVAAATVGPGAGGMTATMSSTGGGMPASSSTGVGGSGTGGTPMFGPSIDAAEVLDATPSPDGKVVYWTGLGKNGAAVFTAASDGSGVAKELASGDPLAAPVGIAVSSDGTKLFIADAGANDAIMPANKSQDTGGIYTLPNDGGTPTLMAGTSHLVPRGIEIHAEGGEDVVYFTAVDPMKGAGVFSVSALGGAVTAVNNAALWRDPSGIAIAGDGTMYVCDTLGDGGRRAQVFSMAKAGMPVAFAAPLQVNYPCGVALSKDDKTLYVSGLDDATRSNRVWASDVAIKDATALYAMEAGKEFEAAGLHRARNASLFSWADGSAGPKHGTVHVLK